MAMKFDGHIRWRNLAIPVDATVIANILPATLLDMPAADLGDVFGQRTPGHPVRAGGGQECCRSAAADQETAHQIALRAFLAAVFNPAGAGS